MRKANRMFEKHDLTAPQAETLFFLMRQEAQGLGAIQRDIEDALRLSNPTVSGTLDRLEKKGFIERKPNPENRRVNQIVLTEQARDLTEQAQEEKNRLDENLLTCLTEEEKETLNTLMNKLLANISNL